MVKVNPAALRIGNNTLGSEDHAVFAGIQCLQCILNLGNGKLSGGLNTPGSEHLIGMMVVIVVMAAAGTMLVMVVMFMLLVVMVSAAAVVILLLMMVVPMLLMVVVTAAAMVIVVMVVMFRFHFG